MSAVARGPRPARQLRRASRPSPISPSRSRRGEWVALIGPNGAGKTTLLRALAGLVPLRRAASSSTARPSRDCAAGERSRGCIAFVPQQPQTPPALTVAEYVLLGRTPHLGYFAVETRPTGASPPRRSRRLGLGAFVAASARLAQRWRAAARRARARARAGGAASCCSTSRRARSTSAASSRRSSSSTSCGASGVLTRRRGDARPQPRRPVRRPAAAARPRSRSSPPGRAAEVLSEGTIGAYYGAAVRVIVDEGGIFVLPRREAPGGRGVSAEPPPATRPRA